jgi:hypothetical protein
MVTRYLFGQLDQGAQNWNQPALSNRKR